MIRGILVSIALLTGLVPVTQAASEAADPIPRFEIIHVGEARLRVGPGERYEIEWVYVRRGLPVEIIGEHDVWRRVRDREGVEGWFHQRLLTGRYRGFILDGNRITDLRREPRPDAPILARVEPNVIGRLLRCPSTDSVAGAWCFVEVAEVSGWLPRDALWGLYPGEIVD